MTDTRVLVVVFDALRPEFLTDDLMPNLTRFAESGVHYRNSRSTYPTETRVNQSAVVTGCMPRSHGVVGNKFIAEDLQPGLLVNSGDDTMLAAAFQAGPVVTRPSLGERLNQSGHSYVSLSAGTPGGGRLINWSAEQDGTHRLAMRNPVACAPRDFFDHICDRIGPMPAYQLPATDWIGWAVTAYLDYIEPEISPDAMLLWLCEPDESFHWRGIGSPDALDTIRAADAHFGRVLEVHRKALDEGSLHIIAMSDHGQISVSGPPLDIVSKLSGIGITASREAMEGANCVISVANSGGIWVRDRDPEMTARITEYLLAQLWCGPVFTREGVLGTLPSSTLFADHARAPDISLALRATDAPNAWGLAGTTLHDSPYPEGGGCHGGLSAYELHNTIVMGGSAFRQGAAIDAPAGNADILPTVLTLLGESIPGDIDGRVLTEAFSTGPDVGELDWSAKTVHSAPGIGPKTFLETSHLGSHSYLNRAWVEP